MNRAELVKEIYSCEDWGFENSFWVAQKIESAYSKKEITDEDRIHLYNLYQREKDKFVREDPYIPRSKKTTVCIDAIIKIGPKVLLIRRKYPPFKGMLAFPGGKVELNETVEECLGREVIEETGLDVKEFELCCVRSERDRDPRGHYISVVYKIIEWDGELNAGDDAAEAQFECVYEDTELAFDHKQILLDETNIVRLRSDYTYGRVL